MKSIEYDFHEMNDLFNNIISPIQLAEAIENVIVNYTVNSYDNTLGDFEDDIYTLWTLRKLIGNIKEKHI